jgi:hypothetical protein
MAIRADVLPRSIELTLNGTTVAVPHIRGRISIDEGRGEVDALTLEGDQWRSDVTGAWRTDSGTLTAHADVSFDADGFPDSLRVALPEAARKALDSAHLRLPGPTSLHDGKVNLVRSPDKALNGVEFSGRIAVSDAALSPAGVQITGLNGGAEISMEKRGAAPVHLDTSMLVDRVKVANVPVTSLRARLVSGSEAGEWILPLASADCFGGRVACSAMTHMGATRQYQAEVTLGGVPLSSVLRAMDRKADSKSKAEPDPRPDRGNVDASFAIAGASGDPSSKRAVGSVRISGGEVVTMPLVLSLIQVSNFQMPSSDRFDFLQSKFHLAGNRVDFDQVALLSNTVSVTGSGSMEWPSEKIDMQFNSQSNRRVPVWTDIVEVIRNEVMTTHVGGTLSEPKVGVEPLSATRRLIGSVLGFSSRIVPADPMTESDARRERDRLRASRRIPPVWRAGAPPAPPTRVPE